MEAFVNRCTNETVTRNYKVFGMSFYGECFSKAGVGNALALFTKNLKDFSRCVSKDYQPCEAGDDRCIGKNAGVGLYQIVEK